MTDATAQTCPSCGELIPCYDDFDRTAGRCHDCSDKHDRALWAAATTPIERVIVWLNHQATYRMEGETDASPIDGGNYPNMPLTFDDLRALVAAAQPQPMFVRLARAAMKAEPNVAPPSIHELEDECLTAYAIIVRGRRRLTEAEARLSAAVRASIRAGRL